MSYIALARKWRPRTFSQLVGQAHVNKALIKSLNQQRMHHAYLFSGTRGVGKTSIARLLAKALNCERGITAEPCLSCETCQSIEQGRFLDLIEIDGASKTRVEDTRDILENVQYSPTNGRFKIYLIDEVHMLSQHSFNALLKTLEEPPAHVKFLLATTDPQKLPITVLSRCLQFHLKPLQPELIIKQLHAILDAETVAYEQAAIGILAKAAQGSMRDALSLLDQVIACSDTTIREEDVKSILGYTKQDYALQLLQALADFNLEALMIISRNIATEGGNFHYVLEEIIDYLHQVCVTQNLQGDSPLISPNNEISALSKKLPKEDAHLFYQIAMKGQNDLYLAPTVAIGFEMTLLRMHTFQPAANNSRPEVVCETTCHNKQQNEKNQPLSPSVCSKQTNNAGIEKAKSHGVLNEQKASSAPIEHELTTSSNDRTNNQHNDETHDNNTSWQAILNQIKLTGLALSAAEHADLLSKEKGQLKLRVAKGHQALFNPTVISRIEKALSDYYKDAIKLTLHEDAEVLTSPAQNKKVINDKKQQSAEQALQNDPFFQKLHDEFSAELVKNSISPLENDL